MGCEPAKKGTCGDSFIGSFKCSFQSECNSEKECICTVNAQCTKTNDQAQEVAGKNSKETLRSVPTKVKSGTEAKIFWDFSVKFEFPAITIWMLEVFGIFR